MEVNTSKLTSDCKWAFIAKGVVVKGWDSDQRVGSYSYFKNYLKKKIWFIPLI
jgi:hypothetical protein